jgi:succinoglycan biosynthesis transport protein ExoP
VDLNGYLRLLRRRWWIIALAVLVSAGAAIGATQLQHKRYHTSTRLIVSGSSSLSVVDEITRRQLAQQRAVLFSQIATTDPVVRAAENAANAAGAGAGAPAVDSAGPAVLASASGTDPFLTITVAASTPEAAQALANVYASVLPRELSKLDQLPSVADSLLTVVNPAPLPTQPFAPRPLRNALIGLALGIVLGIAAALIRETLDTTLRDSEEVRRITQATILGVIPREFDDERLPAATRPHSRRSEAYRQVRTNLEFAGNHEPPRSFVITSAEQGEGKSATVANVALLVSRAGKRVAIVDADLRKPTLASFFNATSDFGLSDVLTGRLDLSAAMQSIAGEQIVVLGSGPTVARPSELLSSPAMERVLSQLRDDFDLVIVDTPPVLAITDALLVGKHGPSTGRNPFADNIHEEQQPADIHCAIVERLSSGLHHHDH